MSTAGRFIKLEKLGEGTYGVVYMAREKTTGAVVALKRMNIAAEEEGVPATTIREIALLKELHHQNVVRLYDVMFQAPKLTLVFEYCEYDLKKYMDSRPGKRLDVESEVRPLMKQLLCGLAFMHQRSVVHRDLKPQNLLLSATRELKLGDFGLARVEGIPVKKYSHEAVTLWYRPPDVILGSTQYGFAVDMWSVGCIFAEMATGTPLFNGHSDAEQLAKIFRLLGTPNATVWPSMQLYPGTRTLIGEAPRGSPLEQQYPPALNDFIRTTPELAALGESGADLLKRMLQYEPSRRITAQEAYAHPFLASVADSQARSVAIMAAQLQAVLDSIAANSANNNGTNSGSGTGTPAMTLQQQQQAAVMTGGVLHHVSSGADLSSNHGAGGAGGGGGGGGGLAAASGAPSGMSRTPIPPSQPRNHHHA